jgi:uncharacterized protein YbjT (DUF2867 family)
MSSNDPLHLGHPGRIPGEFRDRGEPEREARPLCKHCRLLGPLPGYDGCLACETAEALADPETFQQDLELGAYKSLEGQLIVQEVNQTIARRITAGEQIEQPRKPEPARTHAAVEVLARASRHAAERGDVDDAEVLLRLAVRERSVA